MNYFKIIATIIVSFSTVSAIPVASGGSELWSNAAENAATKPAATAPGTNPKLIGQNPGSQPKKYGPFGK